MSTECRPKSNTPVPALVTHEPGLTSTLARRMSAGTGHGRAGGVDLGGRIGLGPTNVIYHIGVFTPAALGPRLMAPITMQYGCDSEPPVCGKPYLRIR